MFRKNVAGQHIHIQGVDTATGGIKSGVTWTVRRCIDGTFAAATGTVTEDGTTGFYKFAMSQADTNGNNIAFNFTGTGAIPQTVNIVTTVLDPTSAAFGLVIAKTTNITGFNDIAATAVVSSGAINTSGGAVSTVTNLTNASTSGDLTATMKTSVTTAATAATPVAASVTGNVGGNVLGSVVAGTVTTGGTTTSIPTSSLTPSAAVTDQFKNRIVIFANDTITTNLRGQATQITASTAGGTLTVSALTDAPVNGDTFRIY